MSHSYYSRQWQEAQSALVDMLLYENPPQPPKPERDRLAAFQLLATMYVKYIQIFRKLEHSYDQIVHPQKRRVLRHCLDGVMGRIVELKHEMMNLEFSEYHYFDDVLSDLKLTPNDVEIPVPKYFVHERTKHLKEREKLLGQILAKMAPQTQGREKVDIYMSWEQAIRVIQINERARQGRLRAKFMREIRQQEEREKHALMHGAPTVDPELAAMRIQKIWKGVAQRRRTRKERDEEMVFIGMAPPPLPSNPKNLPQTLAVKTEEQRRKTQEVHEHEYQQALVNIKENIIKNEGPDLREGMMDQIRQWFIECRDVTGKFPEYPSEEDGGSLVIFKEKDPAELEKELKEKEEGKSKSGKKDKKKKEKKKKTEKKDKKGKKGKKGDDDDEEEGWKMAPSSFVPAIGEAVDTYKSVWLARNEADNFNQKHDSELIREEKRREVEQEIRTQVDELMRAELANLKAAVDRDKKGKKGKKAGKKKKKKKKKGKKGKKGRKGRKKEKDLTSDRTIEDLYEELVVQGIIVRTPQVRLSDYEGEYSYLGTTLRQANIEPMPSLSDVRRLVTEFAILPLGSPAVHEKVPLTRSILIAGPQGTGKKMLVHAMCTELGANLFDLSPANLAGKYPGRDGLKMLMHLIYKIGRTLQPSIFYIGDCERMFKKKIPKSDPTDPKRLKKELTKSLKTIKSDDRILLVGTTHCPFDAELKPFMSCYQRVILIPRPDYASRHLLWRKLILKFGGQVTNHMDVSSLSKVTDGYTPGHMVTAIQQGTEFFFQAHLEMVACGIFNDFPAASYQEATKYHSQSWYSDIKISQLVLVLTDRRIQQLSKKPLQGVEFVAPLARLDPVYKEEEESFKSWYAKTPMGKQRAKAAQADEDDAGGKKGKGKSAKGKKEGKKGKKKKK